MKKDLEQIIERRANEILTRKRKGIIFKDALESKKSVVQICKE